VTGPVRYSPSWLALREPADARARAGDLAARAAAELRGSRVVVHDLGCGTGSMLRWLAPRLPGPQHWVLHDRDEDLLRLARTGAPTAVAGGPVTVELHPGDLTRLTAADLTGATLVTASALLDLLTLDEVRRLAAACAASARPALLTLTVAGRVELAPGHRLDDVVGAAFDAHQRRVVSGRRLLGPDAPAATRDAFTGLGAGVVTRPSVWLLAPDDAGLAAAWLRGWVGAAHEQRPDLPLEGYLRSRLEAAHQGRLRIEVHHEDLLVRWG
jgi:hypothetical protein